jgi:hypothetical protein
MSQFGYQFSTSTPQVDISTATAHGFSEALDRKPT